MSLFRQLMPYLRRQARWLWLGAVCGLVMNVSAVLPPVALGKALDAVGLPYKYLEYGSYLGEWRRRLALKMWTGWPTFPMVFVKGVLVGGAGDLARLIEKGEVGGKR